MKLMLDLVRRHKQATNSGHGSTAIGIPSVCSAHPVVIAATLRECAMQGRPALIEATSNQVNQDGGYTGMTPLDFRRYVRDMAAQEGLAPELLLLGGDHLGPNAWRKLTADVAMAKAEVMVAQYVAAGFRKIHLDCSMSCAGDPVPLPEPEIAANEPFACAVRPSRPGETRRTVAIRPSTSSAPKCPCPAAPTRIWGSWT